MGLPEIAALSDGRNEWTKVGHQLRLPCLDMKFPAPTPHARYSAAATSCSEVARDRERIFHLIERTRHDHAERHDLIVRGVGGVAPAGRRIELNLAQDLRLEAPFEAGQHGLRHSSDPRPAGT